MKEIVFYTAQQDDFEKCYLEVRKKEGFVYSDREVGILPNLPKAHPHYTIWEQRRKNANTFCKYMKDKEVNSILEIGCGNGWFSHQIALNSEAEVLGFDINLNELKQANRVFNKINLRFGYGDVFESKFLKKFDVIVLNASAQYFECMDFLVKRLKDILSENGEIHILDTHFYQNKSKAKEAKERTKEYYNKLGSQDMVTNYFHHCKRDVIEFDKMKSPWVDRVFKKNGSPFNWFRLVLSP